MKRALLVTAIALALGACSSTKSTNKAEDPGSVDRKSTRLNSKSH